MGFFEKLTNRVYKWGDLGYLLYKMGYWYVYYVVQGNIGTDKKISERKFKKYHGREINWNNPITLNEKIFWLKLYDRRSIHKILADKYAMRSWMGSKFGNEYLIPLLYKTNRWQDITMDVIPDEPCIIKASHTSGDYIICRDKSELDIEKVRFMCRCWLGTNFYLQTQEWQYKDTERTIVIEKLLTGSNGHIPNDYKLHFINGELAFIYCSVDREGSNKRNIYDANWKPLNFFWVEGCKDVSNLRGEEITPPESLPKMIEIGKNIAEMFDYVRVDFYDIEGKLYFGEVTFHHGSGHDVFTPVEYDEYFGKQLILHKR